jgi:zinc transport system substrate-binding protein
MYASAPSTLILGVGVPVIRARSASDGSPPRYANLKVQVCRTISRAWLLMMLVIGSCRPAAPASRPATPAAEPSDRPIPVFVSIPPQKCFVERVGGEHVRVSVVLAPGQSPHTYEPTSKQLVHLGAARLYFTIGFPFEKQLAGKVASTFKDLKLVDTREGIDLRMMTEDEEEADEHGGEQHEHQLPDPHVWMSPRLVKVQARTICRALGRLDPSHGAEYEVNCRAFEADLDRVDAKIAAALAPLRGREFYVYHPAFGYFADAYGLKQVAVEQGGKQPTAKQLAALIAQAKTAGVRLVFVQPQYAKKNAETLAAEIGGAVVSLDTLAEDYVGNLLDVAEKIQKALTDRSKHDGV